MHIPWSEVQLFLAVSEAGSVSGAAKVLQVTQPTVSRRLAELEADLGEPLFTRRVDGTSLTSFGERLLEPARRMADCAGEVQRVASGAEANPRGVVRITAPPGVAFLFLAPFAAHLRAVLPEVRLEIVSTVNYLDLARREADLAVRLQPLTARKGQGGRPGDLVALASVEHAVAALATPEYVATLPVGYGFADVGWIGWAPPLEHLPPNPQLAAAIPGFRPVFASDDYLVQLRAAEAGVGAILGSRFQPRLALPTRLVAMSLDMGKVTASSHLVCARSSLSIPRVRAVADLLASEMLPARPAKVARGRRPA
jgi:DNA-binding transcriptional LysR family regulator